MPRSAVPNTGSIITTIRTKWPWILAGLLVVVLVTMLSPDPDDTLASGTGPAAPTEATDAQQIQVAFTQLSTLEVKGRAPKTGYDRELFGPSWTDNVSVALGRNGCDTRNDILRRDLVDITSRDRTRDCVVQAGTLRDLYTGNIIAFTRGTKTSDAVQIDHVVALSDAWQKALSSSTRRRGPTSRTIPAICRRWTDPPISARAMPTRRRGCPRWRRTAAPTWHGRWK